MSLSVIGFRLFMLVRPPVGAGPVGDSWQGPAAKAMPGGGMACLSTARPCQMA